MLTEAGRHLIKEALYTDTFNKATARLIGRLGRGAFRLGARGVRTGVPLAGRIGLTGVKGLGNTLQWASDLAVKRPALALSAVGVPAAYAVTRHAPDRMEAMLAYGDPHSRAATYRLGLLRNNIVPHNG